MQATKFTAGVNDFTFNLFRAVNVKGNLICSPKNIADCAALLYPAARGNTATALGKTCGFPESSSDALKCIGEMNGALSADKFATIKTANGVWCANKYPWDTGYMKLLKEDCGAQMATCDFTDPANYEAICKEVNDWVGQKTLSEKGEPLIKDLLKPDHLNKDTVIALVTAIYYLGKFKYKFNPATTRKQPFTLTDGKKADCQMMTQQGSFRCVETDTFVLCDLPYAGDTVLSIILPKKIGTLSEIEGKLNASAFNALCSGGNFGDTVVMLPKFKIESTLEDNLKDGLCALGMELCFSDNADFRGAIENGTEEAAQGIKIGKAIHKAFVDTTEEGTEAAAATVMTGVRCASAPMPSKPPRKFICDQPFLFTIWHRPSAGVLFVGRHEKPAGY